MKVKITEQKDNPLLSRKEIKAEVEFDSKVPSREEIRGELSRLAKTDKENMIIIKVNSTFGQKKAIALANVYPNKADIKKVQSASKRLEKQMETKVADAPAPGEAEAAE